MNLLAPRELHRRSSGPNRWLTLLAWQGITARAVIHGKLRGGPPNQANRKPQIPDILA
jgi:hypothetical protein